MSVDAVLGRISQLEAMVASASAAPAASGGAMAPAAFADALASATGASGAAAVPSASAAAPAGPSALPAGTPYGAEITAAARRHGLDPALLAALVKQESGFDAGAVSPAGARGLTQLMPATAAGLGVTDPTDPAQALEGGAKYLKAQLDRFGDADRALAAYNAGPGAVQRYGGVPPYAETQAYVRRVEAYAAAFRSQPTSASP